RVEILSRKDRGTTVRLRLPIEVGATAARRSDRKKTRMTDDIEPGAKGIRILIADDHPLIRAGMRTCLAAHHDWHVCAEADNGEAALLLARAHRPDVVVLDVSLPLCNGLEVTRSLCRQFPGLGVVIYTMHEEQQLLMDLLKAGARGWVSKNEDDV